MDVWIPMVVGNALQENRPVLLIGSGERKHSIIAAANVAAFAVAALNNATALNRKISLGGPEPLSWGESSRLWKPGWAGRSRLRGFQ